MKFILILVIIAIAIVGYGSYQNSLHRKVEFSAGEVTIIKSNNEEIKLKVRVADNVSSRAKGLMDVKQLPEDEGMLFVFEQEDMRKMWMKDTYIPLDMIFIDGKNTIFNFRENAKPQSTEIILSMGFAKYVMEVNAGFIKKNNIHAGDKIKFTVTN